MCVSNVTKRKRDSESILEAVIDGGTVGDWVTYKYTIFKLGV